MVVRGVERISFFGPVDLVFIVFEKRLYCVNICMCFQKSYEMLKCFLNKLSKEEGVIILTYNDVQRKRTLALEQLRYYKPKFLNCSKMFSLHDRNMIMHLVLSHQYGPTLDKINCKQNDYLFSSEATL